MITNQLPNKACTIISEAKSLMIRMMHAISQVKPDLLQTYPVERYIAELDSYQGYGRYGHFSDDLEAQGREIIALAGSATLENYHKLVMLSLIEEFTVRAASRKLPISIIDLFCPQYQRIVDEMSMERKGYYLAGSTRFLADLALCRMKLYPCGAELLDEFSGIPRKILFTHGSSQLLRVLSFFTIKRHRFRPWYELHMHDSLKPEFHLEGWISSFLRIADLLLLNPEIEGVSCGSWWYDPQIEAISPRLKYLRNIPLDGGAEIFRVETDRGARTGSISKSENRKNLYHSGRYVPELYMMAWHRDELIKWAVERRSTTK
jgi:hypothetical protein